MEREILRRVSHLEDIESDCRARTGEWIASNGVKWTHQEQLNIRVQTVMEEVRRELERIRARITWVAGAAAAGAGILSVLGPHIAKHFGW